MIETRGDHQGAAGGPSEPNEPAARAVNAGLPLGGVLPGSFDGQGPEAGNPFKNEDQK